MKTEYVVLVDELDQPLDLAEKLDAHQRGLLHRAFSVFVVQQRGSEWYTLLQRRNLNKYHSPGLWTNTCCSHPSLHEIPEAGGERRLMEEMGIKLSCQKIGDFIYRAELDNDLIEHEYDHVLIGYAPENFHYTVNPAEVMDHRWVSFSELHQAREDQSTQFTPWFFTALDVVRQYLARTH